MRRIRSIRTASLMALVVAGILAAVAIIADQAFASSTSTVATSTAAKGVTATVTKPKIVKKYIRYGSGRKKQTTAYCRRHYGQSTYKLTKPKAIVLHHTAGSSWKSAWNHFNANAAYGGEKPGVSAHFIIGKGGTIYQCLPPWKRARHAIGMNWKSIGIELVQEPRSGKDGHWMDKQVLKRSKQMKSALRLVRWLQKRYGIKKADVVGHAMANDSRFFKDRTGIKNAAGDWYAAEVKVFRSRL